MYLRLDSFADDTLSSFVWIVICMDKFLKIIKGIGIVVGVILAAVVVLFTFLTIKEYKPASKEEIAVSGNGDAVIAGDVYSIITFNIGYGAYDRDEDFFMDGGKKVRPDSVDDVYSNLSGISATINKYDADVYFVQEVDIDSHRSYNVNELAYLESATGHKGIYAANFNAVYVPYPIPPIGKVHSGIVTFTDLNVREATRISLPEAFKWPVKIANLKRCMLETRIPIEGSDRELVLINFHLEAYDNGEGKIKQTQILKEKLEEEYSMGNYVIAGGDFNQQFDTVQAPAVIDADAWMPGSISESELPDGFGFAVNDNLPTCRSLAEPFESIEKSQTYIIDGFIVSDNIRVNNVEVLDEDFAYSDHQPVQLEFSLK